MELLDNCSGNSQIRKGKDRCHLQSKLAKPRLDPALPFSQVIIILCCYIYLQIIFVRFEKWERLKECHPASIIRLQCLQVFILLWEQSSTERERELACCYRPKSQQNGNSFIMPRMKSNQSSMTIIAAKGNYKRRALTHKDSIWWPLNICCPTRKSSPNHKIKVSQIGPLVMHQTTRVINISPLRLHSRTCIAKTAVSSL